jgi:hypothetical protein
VDADKARASAQGVIFSQLCLRDETLGDRLLDLTSSPPPSS